MNAGTPTKIRVAGDTNVGRVRTTNEDSLVVDFSTGLYAVFDGMGGANAGDVASQTARDAVRDYVIARHDKFADPKQLLEAALQAGSAAVFSASQQARERHGMGTTAVAALVVEGGRAIIGHVGDSRAYLHRNGRLALLTRDHTIVEDLVDRGLLAADEAERHPYKNVLSRNLGARPETKVDLCEIEIKPGDRLMLCSDGLYGYASTEAIQYLLGSGDAPEHVARDLIDLALRGGGGDNVSTIVIEAPAPPPTSTQVVRTSGAVAWWQHRQLFLRSAKERGLLRNPIVRGLAPDEAMDLVGSSLCQAIFHDLEKSTGVNVWTYAQNLAGGWFARGGDWGALRGLVDILGMAARSVVDDIRNSDANLGFLLDVAISRALVVAELALGGLLAERLRQVDADLIRLHATLQQRAEQLAKAVMVTDLEGHAVEDVSTSHPRFVDTPTIPFLRPERQATGAGFDEELLDAITKTLTIARGRVAPRAELLKQILASLEVIVTDSSTNFSAAVNAARELYGVRPVDDAGVMPLFDALDQARILTAASVQQIKATDSVRAQVLLALSYAHQRLVSASTALVLEAVSPFSDRLKEVQGQTADMRDQVAKLEKRRADLEKKFATIVDPSLPWGARGTTEW